MLAEMCSVCPAAERCPYYGHDVYNWNMRSDERCDEIIESVIEKQRKDFYSAWMDYASEYED